MSVTPYLTLTDANPAIDVYVEAFGAVEQFRLPAEDGKKINSVTEMLNAPKA